MPELTAAPPIDYAQLIAAPIQFYLYNGAEVEMEGGYNGETYRLPSRYENRFGLGLGVYPIPVPGSRPPVEYINDEGVKNKKPTKPLEIRFIVKHFVGDDGRTGMLGNCGVRVLINPLSDPRNKLIQKDARDTADVVKYQQALSLKIGHMQRVHKEAELGIPVHMRTPPSPEVQEAMRLLAEREATAGRYIRFTCELCAMPHLNKRDHEAHMELIHGADVAPKAQTKGPQVVPDETEPEEPPSEEVKASQSAIDKINSQLDALGALEADEPEAPEAPARRKQRA